MEIPDEDTELYKKTDFEMPDYFLFYSLMNRYIDYTKRGLEFDGRLICDLHTGLEEEIKIIGRSIHYKFNTGLSEGQGLANCIFSNNTEWTFEMHKPEYFEKADRHIPIHDLHDKLASYNTERALVKQLTKSSIFETDTSRRPYSAKWDRIDLPSIDVQYFEADEGN